MDALDLRIEQHFVPDEPRHEARAAVELKHLIKRRCLINTIKHPDVASQHFRGRFISS